MPQVGKDGGVVTYRGQCGSWDVQKFEEFWGWYVMGRGVATGGIWVYIPPPPQKNISPINFLWGRNDVGTAIEHEY